MLLLIKIQLNHNFLVLKTTVRSPTPEVFLGSVLKMSVSCKFAAYFQKPFPKNTHRVLLLFKLFLSLRNSNFFNTLKL